MKKFIVIYHAPLSATEQMAQVSPEEMQKGMEPWMVWAENSRQQHNTLVTERKPLRVSSPGRLPEDSLSGDT